MTNRKFVLDVTDIAQRVEWLRFEKVRDRTGCVYVIRRIEELADEQNY